MEGESEIIRRVAGGERDLFAELVREHQAHLFQLCLAILGDRHAAEEAAQESFIKAYRALPRFRGGSTFRTWLTRIGINHCRDILKKKRRARTVYLEDVLGETDRLPESLVENPPEPRFDAKVPPGALGLLSQGEREVFQAAAERPGAGYDELGRVLGLSRDSVKGRLKRAREKIQSYLGKHGVQ